MRKDLDFLYKCVSFKTLPASAVSISSISVHEAINPTVKLYPNPSRGRFVVELHLAEKINGKATIQLMDMTGKTVYSENGTINNGVLRKNVSLSSSLAKGMYMARTIVNNKTYKAQLVYEK